MKKKIFMLAIAAAVFCGFSASAQRQNNPKADRVSTEMSDKMYRPQTFTDFAFEGILLDINQQTRVDSLNAAFKAKKERKCCEAGKQCTDSAKACKTKAYDTRRERIKASDNGRKEYIAKVKEILTPEQYTQFLENIVNMPKTEAMRPVHKDAKQMKEFDGKHKHGKDVKKAEGQYKKQKSSLEKKSR